MAKIIFPALLLLVHVSGSAQLRWINMDTAFGALPASVHLYKTTDSLDGKPNIAWYLEADLKDKNLVFSADTTLERRLTPQQLTELKVEMNQLREFHNLAKSIIKNSKGEVLLSALRNGFAASTQVQQGQGAATLQQKAVIFTESRRTASGNCRMASRALG